MSFQLETYRNGETIYVRVAGRVVLDECERFKNSCVPLVQAGVKRVAVEMSGVEFIDSAGLGVLVGLKMTANKVKAKMSIISPSQGVADILYVSKLDGIFDVVTGPPADMLREENCQPEYRTTGMAPGVPGPAPLAAAPPPLAPMAPPSMAPPGPPRPMAPGSPPPGMAPIQPMGGAPMPPGPAPRPTMPAPGHPQMPGAPHPAPGWNAPQRPAAPSMPAPQRPAAPGFGAAPGAGPRPGGIAPMGGAPNPGMISPMGSPAGRPAPSAAPMVEANDPLFAPPMGDPGFGGSLEPMGGGIETAMPGDFGFGAPPADLGPMSPMGFMEDIPLPDNLPPMIPEGDSTLDEGILGELGAGGPMPLGNTQIQPPAGAPPQRPRYGADLPNVNGTLDEVSMTSLSFGAGFGAGIGGEGTSHAKTPKEMAEHHCSRAFEFMRQGAYEESIKEYQQALQLNPDYLPAHNNLAIVYEKKPSWHAQAISQWERVYELSKMKGDQKHIDRAQKHLNNLRKMNNL